MESRESRESRQSQTPLQFYSEPLPGVDCSELRGKLIVIEGPDAVGRSTQIRQLRQWLEQEGHAVLDSGMARSALAGRLRGADRPVHLLDHGAGHRAR